MASGDGIQKLLAAEGAAAQIVAEARKVSMQCAQCQRICAAAKAGGHLMAGKRVLYTSPMQNIHNQQLCATSA